MLKFSVGKKLLVLFGCLAVLAVLTGLMSVLTTLHMSDRGFDAAEKLAPLGDAAMEIKLSATHAHLLFEEIIGGDEGEDIQQVWTLLADTQFYANAILEGGENDEGKFFASTNPKVRELVKGIQIDVADFIEVAHLRYDARGRNSGAGSSADERFDQAFEKFIANADVVEELIHDDMDRGIADMRAGRTQGVIVVVVGAGLSLLLAIGAYIFASRNISRRLTELSKATTDLAEGNINANLPDWKSSDELGELRDSLVVFRSALSEREELQTSNERSSQEVANRAANSQQLNVAIADVVDAAVKGDFSRRIDANYSETELNNLAEGINNLVATVDRGIGETGEVLSALADTDLTKRVNGEYQGAFAKLKDDTNSMADKLTDIVGQLRETSGGVKTATGEILSGANDLSERTTKQAATIEETSAAMEQLATTVIENAKKADDASSKSQSVARTAEEGGEVVSQANDAMERITSSSEKISNIIGMIDDIAFQTNLLALNASVEAARAGEAGKGFAVVAVEVRRLAQSAAEASSEVKVLIEQSAVEVGQGSKLVTEAAAKLTEMIGSIRENSTLIEQIANDSREQASSIEEVNTAVRQMDEMTQHNAALVEETNAAIEQTEAQANELDNIVDVFRIDDTVRSAAPSSEAPASRPAPKAKPVATRYLSEGNAAVDKDWSEF